MNNSAKNYKNGLLLAIVTYSIWGFFPLYFKLLAGVAVDEIIVHRIVWSAVFTFSLVIFFNRLNVIKLIFKDTKLLIRLTISALLLAANWFIFIYATLDNDVLQLSLGYYINPIFNVFFGLLLFKESLNVYSKAAIVLVLLGLSVQFWRIEEFPVLAVLVALVFSLYGVVRKGIKIDAVSSLLVETLMLLVPSGIYLLFFTQAESLRLMQADIYWLVVLMLAGPITSIPLMTFSAAVQRIPYYLMGFCQYITPTCMFLLAIYVYQESWSYLDAITFTFIWLAILSVAFGLWKEKKCLIENAN